jgi:branched-chain amino acid transport system permease protein
MDKAFEVLWRVIVVATLLAFVSPPFLMAIGVIDSVQLLQYLQQVASGIANGCVYALVALGIVLIYKATETINFAQGEILMIGAFLAFTFINLLGLNFWLGALLAAVATAFVGMAVDRVIIRPMVGQPAFAIVMVTLGFGFVARSGASMIPAWGTESYAIERPFANEVLSLGQVAISYDHAMIVATTVVLCTVLFLFFRFTKLGIAMQAASQNQLAAYYMGIPVKSIFTLIWGLSAAVAGLAGLMLAPFTFVHTNMGMVVFRAFPAAVLGGFGSIPGAIVGGIVIGIVESLAGFYLDEGIKNVAAYIVLLLVLVLKPEGMFGVVHRKKV